MRLPADWTVNAADPVRLAGDALKKRQRRQGMGAAMTRAARPVAVVLLAAMLIGVAIFFGVWR